MLILIITAATGDEALVKIVGVVKSNVRGNDFIGRFGGDEFIICLDFPTRDLLISRLCLIRDGIRGLGLINGGKPVLLSVSIGAAKFRPGTNCTEEGLMKKADFELFNVKRTGRGAISIEDD